MITDSNTSSLKTVKTDEFLPQVSLWTSLGGFFLLGTVAIAFIIAALVKYDIKVRASGNIRPTGELKLVQAVTKGPVKNILVKENQVVKKGDPIAEIDDTELQTQRIKFQGNLQRSQAQLAQIESQIKALEEQRYSELQLINRNIAAAKAQLEQKQRELQKEQVEAKTELPAAKAAFDVAKQDLTQYKEYFYTGSVSSELLLKQKQEAFQTAQSRLERAKAALNPTAASVSIAKEEIAQSQAKGESTLAGFKKEKESLLSSRVETRNQISSDLQELKQVETNIQKSVVRAPAPGVVLKLVLRNPGQFVDSGQEIAQIAPSEVPLIIKAKVPVEDISQVQTCPDLPVEQCQQGRVQLQISAYPYPDYGILPGAVRAIAPDAATPDDKNSSGVDSTYYEVTIEPQSPYLVRDSRQYSLQPGMEVTANIISRNETLLTFILRKARLVTNI
jgi:HlyD family type I secretion membrane fusion protein